MTEQALEQIDHLKAQDHCQHDTYHLLVLALLGHDHIGTFDWNFTFEGGALISQWKVCHAIPLFLRSFYSPDFSQAHSKYP
jgi:hypothetical protein